MAARHGVFLLLLVIVIQTVESKRKVICENSKTTLSCQSNQVIKIKQATYGRSDKRTCKHPNINTTRCSTNKPLGISRKNCNGRKSCTVSANNGLYGDPCPGTYKYVTVSYSCKGIKPKKPKKHKEPKKPKKPKKPKCRTKCHKKAMCINGKCVCKPRYQGDGVRYCKNKKNKTPKCLRKCHRQAKCIRGKCVCNSGYKGDGIRSCTTIEVQTSKCRWKCHKKARCIKGKCVCKGKYQGDGIRSCKKAKLSAYIGCYQDDSKRILSKKVLKDKRMTVQKCQQFCGQKGFKYAGVEYGFECFCGNVLRKDRKRKESDCKTPCAGNKRQICGGTWRISIYTVAKTSKCMQKCHKKAKCRKRKCVCKAKYQGDGVKSCKKVKLQTSKCRNTCHKKARCIKGKCVCKGKYQGDGVRSCQRAKTSRKWKCYHYTLANKLAIKLLGQKSICEKHGRKFTKGKNERYPGCGTCWCCQKAKGKPPKCMQKCHKKAKCRKGKCVCNRKYQGDGVKSCKKMKPSNKWKCYHYTLANKLAIKLYGEKSICERHGRKFTKGKNKRYSGCRTCWCCQKAKVQTSKCRNKCHKKARCKKGKCVCKGKYQGDGVRSCQKAKPSRKWKCYHYTLANKLAIKLLGQKSICEKHGRKFTKGKNKRYPGCGTCWCCQKAKGKPPKCMQKCHKKAKCRKGKCVCKRKYQGDGVKSCKKMKPSRKWKCYHYTLANKLAIKLYGEKSICERHGRKFTKGKNKRYPGCRTCWCCQKAKGKPPKCRNKCHKKANCRKGKCVCKSKYQGDGIKSCKKAKKSAYFGCYQDHSKRILPNDVLTDKRMTVQKCRQFCGKKGFKYAGVENGNECFCGDVLRKNQQRKESDCKTPCSGNKQQICGGPWRISIYTVQTSKCRSKCHKKARCIKGKCVCKGKYQGDGVRSCKKAKPSRKWKCYHYTLANKLAIKLYGEKSICERHGRKFTKGRNKSYPGCRTCWCCQKAKVQTSKCRSKCHKKARCINGKCVCKGKYQGDGVRSCKKAKPSRKWKCYHYTLANKLAIKLLGEKSICEKHGRKFTKGKNKSYPGCATCWCCQKAKGKPPKCMQKCHKKAKCRKEKCVCKRKYQGDGVKSCKKMKPSRKWKCYHYTLANKLAIKLYGEKSICERHGRKFTKGKNKSYPGCRTCWCCQKAKGKPPKCRNKCHKKANCRKGKCVCKSKYQGDGIKSCKKAKKSAYFGCYQDHSKRILPKDVLTDKRMTVRKCRQFCGKKRFKYAGVENGNECFCGDVLRKNKKRKESDCKTPCSGNKQQICGGPWRISIYTAQTSKCKNKCHKKAKCRKGKCVCKGKYQGDGVKSCKKVKQCRKTAKGKEYKGRISLTQTGRTCQYWERQYPHKHPFSISFKTEHNYCRNPDNSGQPWCYTNDPTTRWEYCQIPMCAPEDPEDVDDCRKTAKGTEYKGRISLTQTGRTCQYWERQYPHKHPFSISFKTEHNYCRNPDNSGQPWCYTNDPTTRWEYCQIPMCAACSVREEIVECKATVRVSGSCFYKSKVGSSCVYTVQLKDSQAIIKTSTQEMVLTNGGNLAECAIFTFNDGTLKIEDDVCKCFEATVVNK